MAHHLPVVGQRPADRKTPIFEKIAIVGFGLIGGSLALAIREQWASGLIIAVDRKDVLESAMRVHAADVGGDDLVMAAEADLIILAAPVRQNLAIVETLADHVPGEALVTDVGGTKVATLAASEGLPPRLRFIGGHPLAGAATGGFEAARPDLFAGRPWLITPRADSLPDDLDRLERFVSALGALPHRIDAEPHDRLVAFLSHLPQLTASALMHVVGEHAGIEGLSLAGRGLRDTTRLASSPPDIWRDIIATNESHLRAALDEMIEVLQAFRRDLPDSGSLEQVFDSAARWKNALEKTEN
jgi:prephenate dehydrogenase